jgi:hypothetical protein
MRAGVVSRDRHTTSMGHRGTGSTKGRYSTPGCTGALYRREGGRLPGEHPRVGRTPAVPVQPPTNPQSEGFDRRLDLGVPMDGLLGRMCTIRGYSARSRVVTCSREVRTDDGLARDAAGVPLGAKHPECRRAAVALLPPHRVLPGQRADKATW